MPARPAWYSRLDRVIRQLEALPRPFIDRAAIEFLLGVGRRRAQQILAPCITDRVGSNGLADRDLLIARLRRLAAGDDGFHEVQRRRKVAAVLEKLRQDRLEQPQLLVAAPVHIVDRDFADLPPGVSLQAGRIIVEFEEPQQALEKRLASPWPLAMTSTDSSGARGTPMPKARKAPATDSAWRWLCDLARAQGLASLLK